MPFDINEFYLNYTFYLVNKFKYKCIKVKYDDKLFKNNPFNEKIKYDYDPWKKEKTFSDLHKYLEIVAANAIGEWYIKCKV